MPITILHSDNLFFLKTFLLFSLSVTAIFSCKSVVDKDPDYWSIYVTMERGAINDNGIDDFSIDSFESYCRTAFFIKTNGSVSLKIQSISNLLKLFQYNEKFQLISAKTANGICELDKMCHYVRFSIHQSEVPQLLGICFYGDSAQVSEVKRVKTGCPHEHITYQINDNVCTTALLTLPINYTNDGDKVPLIIWDSGDGGFYDWSKYDGDKNEGREKGLNYLRDQGFAILEIYSWGSNYYKKYPGCGGRSAMPIPTHLAAHEMGVQYVLSRYNVSSENIFHISKSGSGKLSLYWAMFKPHFHLKSIYAFSPVFDDLNFVVWGNQNYRQALFEELELKGTREEVDDFLNGTPYSFDMQYVIDNNLNINLDYFWHIHNPLGRSFIVKNFDKFKYISVDWFNVVGQTDFEAIEATHRFSEIFWEGYNRHFNPATNKFYFSWDNGSSPANKKNSYTRHNLIRKGNGIPIMVVMSPGDKQTPYWNALEVVNQLKNGGNNASMVTLETGGHFGPDLSTSGPNTVSNLITKTGVQYDNVSIGWVLVAEDIISHYLNN